MKVCSIVDKKYEREFDKKKVYTKMTKKERKNVLIRWSRKVIVSNKRSKQKGKNVKGLEKVCEVRRERKKGFERLNRKDRWSIGVW